jgi:hypothetical protein
MDQQEILSRLCAYDPRNPDRLDLDDEDQPQPRTNCFCDNCFYGRDALALEILRLQGEHRAK